MTIYYETVRNGLVPVRDARMIDGRVTAIVSRTRGTYKAGEEITSSPLWFVEKTHVSSGVQYVKQAKMRAPMEFIEGPEVTDE